MIGWHTVRIQEGTVAAGADGKKIKGVPPHYNKSGELRREVKPGNNEINFELTTVEK